jgi:hypothetical protein
MGSGAEGEDVGGLGEGAEPCTVNTYTIVLSSSTDVPSRGSLGNSEINIEKGFLV